MTQLFDSGYDLSLEDDGNVEGFSGKKIRFGRSSGQWRFVERTPSPDKGPEIQSVKSTELGPEQEPVATTAVDQELRSGDGENKPAGTYGQIQSAAPQSRTSPPLALVSTELGELDDEIQDEEQLVDGNQPLDQSGGNLGVEASPETIPSAAEDLRLPINTSITISTTHLSLVNVADEDGPPKSPHLEPVPSPDLPIVSPLFDRKGNLISHFDPSEEITQARQLGDLKDAQSSRGPVDLRDSTDDRTTEYGELSNKNSYTIGSSAEVTLPLPEQTWQNDSEMARIENHDTTMESSASLQTELVSDISDPFTYPNAGISSPYYGVPSGLNEPTLSRPQSYVDDLESQEQWEQGRILVQGLLSSDDTTGQKPISNDGDQDHENRKEDSVNDVQGEEAVMASSGDSPEQSLGSFSSGMDPGTLATQPENTNDQVLESSTPLVQHRELLPELDQSSGDQESVESSIEEGEGEQNNRFSGNEVFEEGSSAASESSLFDVSEGDSMSRGLSCLDETFNGQQIYDVESPSKGSSTPLSLNPPDEEISCEMEEVVHWDVHDTEEESEVESEQDTKGYLGDEDEDKGDSEEASEGDEDEQPMFQPKVEIINLESEEDEGDSPSISSSQGEISMRLQAQLEAHNVNSGFGSWYEGKQPEAEFPPENSLARGEAHLSIDPYLNVRDSLDTKDVAPISADNSVSEDNLLPGHFRSLQSPRHEEHADVHLKETTSPSFLEDSPNERTSSFVKEGRSPDLNSVLDPALQAHLLTPDPTQQSQPLSFVSEPLLQSPGNRFYLITPSLTQSTIGNFAPASAQSNPEQLPLVEKLRSIRTPSRRFSHDKLGDRVSNAISPWFTPNDTKLLEIQGESEATSSQESKEGSVTSASPRTDKPPSDNTELFPTSPEISTLPRPRGPAGFRTPLSYFIPLPNLAEHFDSTVDVLAVALYASAPIRAKSGPRDFFQTAYVVDPPSSRGRLRPQPTVVQMFRPYKEALPLLYQGDALLLRNFKVQSQKQRPILISTESSAWAVFQKGQDVQMRGPPVELGAEERLFAKGLREWWGSLNEEYKEDLQRKVSNSMEKEKQKTNDKEVSAKNNELANSVHELRDGTTYSDEPVTTQNGFHELRDGTKYRDLN